MYNLLGRADDTRCPAAGSGKNCLNLKGLADCHAIAPILFYFLRENTAWRSAGARRLRKTESNKMLTNLVNNDIFELTKLVNDRGII